MEPGYAGRKHPVDPVVIRGRVAQVRIPVVTRFVLGVCAGAATLGGCSLGSPSPGSTQTLPYMQSANALRALGATGAGKITHIVYIVQENRSFNNLFYGYPGAYTVTEGKDSKGHTIELKPSKLGTFYDIDHSGSGNDRGLQRYGHAARDGLPDERIQ